MVEVKFWETVSQRKKEEPLGVFNIDVVPADVPEVSEKLRGHLNQNGEDLYELAVARRNRKIEKAILDCKCAALDKVREIVGYEGVLVANIIEEEN